MWMFEGVVLDYISQLSALLTSLVGGLTALIFQPLIKKIDSRAELSARVWSRIQDKRFAAYEAILETCKELRERLINDFGCAELAA
jgi:lipase chaperone LimK